MAATKKEFSQPKPGETVDHYTHCGATTVSIPFLSCSTSPSNPCPPRCSRRHHRHPDPASRRRWQVEAEGYDETDDLAAVWAGCSHRGLRVGRGRGSVLFCAVDGCLWFAEVSRLPDTPVTAPYGVFGL
jgi:hypothetical protein